METVTQPILYLDTTLLMHSSIDFLLLYLTGKLCLLKSPKWKLFIASILGGIYGTAYMMNAHPILISPWLRLVFPLLLISIAFHPSNRKDWVNSIAVFTLLNIITTGTIFLLFFMQVPMGKFHHIFIWGAGAAILWGITHQLLRAIPKLSHKITEVVVEICLGGKTIHCHGFVDTGNSLVDPTDHKPVIVIRNQLFQPILNLEKGGKDVPGSNLQVLYQQLLQNEQLKERLRVVPYNSVGKNHGMMIGFRSDMVIIKNDLTTRKHQGIVIAITEEKIPDCLIPAVLL